MGQANLNRCALVMVLLACLGLGCNSKSKQCTAVLAAAKEVEAALDKARDDKKMSDSEADALDDSLVAVEVTDEQLDVLRRDYTTRAHEYAASMQMLLATRESGDKTERSRLGVEFEKDGQGRMESLHAIEDHCAD